METIRFRSEDSFCAANLYLPEDLKAGERRPALVLGHGFGAVKEGIDQEACYFSRAGFITLAVDYRSFGESGGTVRGELFPLCQVEDLRNAVSYLETRADVVADRIGLWTTSFGGGIGIHTAAVDRRIAAVVAQVPIVDGGWWMQVLRNTEQYEYLLDRVEADRRERFRGGGSARVKSLATFKSGEFCAMPTDDEIYGFSEQSKTTSMQRLLDSITVESLEKVLEWHPIDVIHRIAPRPLCIVAASGYDICHRIDHILAAYEKAREPKRLHLVPCGQMDLYMEPTLKIGMGHAIDWFNTHLCA